MGFSLGNEGGNYWKFADGKFCRKIEEPTNKQMKQYRRRQLKNQDGSPGELIWEEAYPEFTGYLIGFRKSETEYNGKPIKQYVLTLRGSGDGQIHHFNLPIKSKAASSFMLRIPNVDLAKEFTMAGFLDKEGKPVFFLRQNKQTVKSAWTREEPGDLPQAKQVEFDGELKWDFSERRVFLESYIERKIVPLLSDPGESVADPNRFHARGLKDKPLQDAPEQVDDQTDDLPF